MLNFHSYLRSFILHSLGVVILLIEGCNGINKQSKVQLLEKELVSFDIDFRCVPQRQGYYEPSNGGPGLFYFADDVTQKKLFFCDSTGKQVSAIDVSGLPDYWMCSYSVYSMDTIVVIDMLQHIYLLNSKGVFHETTLRIPDWQGHPYMSSTGTVPCNAIRNFGYIWVIPSLKTDVPKFSLAEEKEYSALKYKGPVLAKIENMTSDSPKVTLQLEGLLKNFMQDSLLSMSVPTFDNDDNAVYYVDFYSDTLYKASIATGQVTGKKQIISDHTSIGVKQISYNANGQQHLDDITKTAATSWFMKYDKYRKCIYLFYHWAVPTNTPPIEQGDHRGWSMLIYNTDLEKIAEFPFEKNGPYDPQTTIITPRGIYFRLLKPTTHGSHKSEYQLFEVVAH